MAIDPSLYEELHAKNPEFGGRGDAGGLTKNMKTSILKLKNAGFSSVLDFGTGKGNLVINLRNQLQGSGITIDGYDPAVEEWAQKPSHPYDIVTCIDVLEHLEHHSIDNFLNELKRYTKHFCFLLIDLQPAVAHLSNGRNAHTLLAPHDWWAAKVAQHFDTTLNFPIHHKGGFMQKYIITASQNTKAMTAMMTFTHKLNIFDAIMSNPKA